MYQKVEGSPDPPENFFLTFDGKLCQDNLWAIVAELISRSEFEGEYTQKFSSEIKAPAKALANRIRGYWGVEKKVHYVPDVTFSEDFSLIRTTPLIQILLSLII
jgi:predicted transposase YbfD/YdcC